jgi:hypothetical protein
MSLRSYMLCCLMQATLATDAMEATAKDILAGEAMVKTPWRMLGVPPKKVDFPKEVVSPPQWAPAVNHQDCSCLVPWAVFKEDSLVVLLHTMHPLHDEWWVRSE